MGPVGPAKLNDGTRTNFSQCGDSTTSSYANGYAPYSPIGSNITYRVDNNQSNGQETYVSGSAAYTCHSAWAFTASDGQSSTETHNDADQVQGTTANPQGYFTVHGHDLAGTNLDLLAAGGFLGNGGSWFNTTSPANDEMEAWDSAC